MNLKKFNLFCSRCNGGRQFYYSGLADAREKLLGLGYYIELKTLEGLVSDLRSRGVTGELGMVGVCPACRGSQYWADGAGIGFEDCFQLRN